ncbi:hypothetical protein [uncultured Brachyspira sp.]|nr:hypothetical protein [uncultured Brachyspira sp.]
MNNSFNNFFSLSSTLREIKLKLSFTVESIGCKRLIPAFISL